MRESSSPLPFENPSLGFWRRLGLTLRLGFSTPLAAYTTLPRGRGLGAPWRLKLLLALPAYLCAALTLGLLQLVLVLSSLGQPAPLPREVLLACPGLLLTLLLLGPLLQFASMLLAGLILHALLWAFRAPSGPGDLRQTIRATGYTQALVGLFLLVPVLGVAAYPGGKVALGLGLARLRRTEPWRGLAAACSQALLTLLVGLALVLALVFWVVRQDQRSRQITLPAPEVLPLPPERGPDWI